LGHQKIWDLRAAELRFPLSIVDTHEHANVEIDAERHHRHHVAAVADGVAVDRAQQNAERLKVTTNDYEFVPIHFVDDNSVKWVQAVLNKRLHV